MTQPTLPLSAERQELIKECLIHQNALDKKLKITTAIASLVATVALALFLVISTSLHPWLICALMPISFGVLNYVLFPALLPFDPHRYQTVATALLRNEDFCRHLDQVQSPINIHTICKIHREYAERTYWDAQPVDYREFERMP